MILNSKSPAISQKTKNLIEKLVLGKLSLTEIAKITGISEELLLSYVKANYDVLTR